MERRLSNHLSFRDRLKALAATPDAEAVAKVIPDVGKWSKRLVDARNSIAHEGTGGETRLFHLERATTGLLTLVLMQRLGLPGEVQRRTAWDSFRPLG